MKHVLLAWELGLASGHMFNLRAVARCLRASGVTTDFALREIDGIEAMFDADLGDVFPAPAPARASPVSVDRPVSYAGILQQSGWDDASSLASRLRVWCSLIRRCGCDALVADHAPTALLAARIMGIPSAVIGNGFALPPIKYQFPAFNPTNGIDLVALEATVLCVVNGALKKLSARPLESLQDLFEGVMSSLFTYRELDPYKRSGNSKYRGAIDLSEGSHVTWASDSQPRIFGYLRPFDGLSNLLEALSMFPAQVILKVADIDPLIYKPFFRRGFSVITHNVNLKLAIEDSDLCISYAPVGTVTEGLLAGKPALLIPGLRERELVAINAHALGAALVLPEHIHYKNDDYSRAIGELINFPKYRSAAEAFAKRYESIDRSRILLDWYSDFVSFCTKDTNSAEYAPI